MPEFVSVLEGAAAPGVINVEDGGCRGMVTLKGDLSSAALARAVKAATGTKVPGPGQSVWSKDGAGALWMAPDELLVLVPREAAADAALKVSAELGTEPHIAVDVSDARAVITLTGPGLRDMLAKLTPADLRPPALAVGTVRRTRLSQVPAAFWLDAEDRATVICFRSVAVYVFDILKGAAADGSVGHLG